MQVTPKTIVSIRYRMKNSRGEVLENIMESAPVSYLHGAGQILPTLESHLTGREAGASASVMVSKAEGFPGLDDDFYFDVIIDQVRWATDEELKRGQPLTTSKNGDCGPECCC